MTEENPTIWRAGVNRVTRDFIRTPRRTIALSHIDQVAIGHPYAAPGLSLAFGCSLLTYRFADVLTGFELALLPGFGWAVALPGILITQLRLHSYSLKDVGLFMPLWRAYAMRRAVDKVLEIKRKQPLSPMQRIAGV